MRSNYTTGEGGKIDTFSQLEYEDDLSEVLNKKVREKKMQEWDQEDVSVFLKEIGMGRPGGESNLQSSTRRCSRRTGSSASPSRKSPSGT